MLLSASRSDTMRMTALDFDRANRLLRAAELKMHRTFGGLGRAKGAIDAQRVLDYVQSLKAVSRAEILNKFYRDVGSQEFKAIEELMMQMQVVDIQVLRSGDKVYKWRHKK